MRKNVKAAAPAAKAKGSMVVSYWGEMGPRSVALGIANQVPMNKISNFLE